MAFCSYKKKNKHDHPAELYQISQCHSEQDHHNHSSYLDLKDTFLH